MVILLQVKNSIANNINNFFVNIGSKLEREINVPSDKKFVHFLPDKRDENFNFTAVDENDIRKIADKLDNKKSCGRSNIIMKSIINILIKPITNIINQMLKTGVLPDKLKVAKVFPLFKKGDPTLLTNYRPISLLPSLSKIFEKVIYQQLYAYFENSNQFFKGQYGFRKGHSTEMASLELADRILSFMDNGDTPIGIFLDLSKAFDTLNNNILLHKLKQYGLSKNSTGLIKNYLENRTQYVNFDNVNSDHQKISTGVPQGSILGPLLFMIYVNDLHNSSKLFQFILFADDTTLLTKKGINNNLINRELCKISIWFKVNKLSLNVPKSKCILFHQPQKKIIEPEIIIDGNKIDCVNNFNFLGLIINKHLNWNNHIDHISLKISRVMFYFYSTTPLYCHI